MKIKLTLLGILVSMGVVSAQTATTKPVGYHTETAKGNAFTLMGVNVGNAIAAAGEFDADAATDNDADFTALLDEGVNCFALSGASSSKKYNPVIAISDMLV